MSSRYSKVERRVWRDEKVRKLSRPLPNARELWLFLLTCDAHGGFPGLFLLRLSVASEDLGWPVADVRRCLGEIESLGMAKYDDAHAVVWLPKAVEKHAERLSPNNAKGWRAAWNELPDCRVTRDAFVAAVAALEAYDGKPGEADALVAAFVARAPKWLLDVDASPLPTPLEPPSSPLPTPLEPPSNQDREAVLINPVP